MLLSKLSSIILLTAGIIIGVAVSSLFKGCEGPALPITPAETVHSVLIKKQVADHESFYQHKIDSLQSASHSLAGKLSSTKQALDKVKRKNVLLQTQVYALLDRPNISSDTSVRLADCDSLKIKVQELMTAGLEKDSVQDLVTANVEQQIENKDSVIAVQQQAYQSLKASFLQSLQQQEQLEGENKFFKKQLRKDKTRKKLASIGMLVLAGLTASYLIHH